MGGAADGHVRPPLAWHARAAHLRRASQGLSAGSLSNFVRARRCVSVSASCLAWRSMGSEAHALLALGGALFLRARAGELKQACEGLFSISLSLSLSLSPCACNGVRPPT